MVREAAQLGFSLHHAEKENIEMTLWLDKPELNALPKYASHYIGLITLITLTTLIILITLITLITLRTLITLITLI